MMGIKTFISTIFKGSDQAYIYVWVSKVEKFIYVGQTNERFGTFGRAFSHIQSDGTLRTRCLERVGLRLEIVTDLYLLSFPLPNTREFISSESSFRIAVEYLVQIGLHDAKMELFPSFQIISNISTSAYVTNQLVKNTASYIINSFKIFYEEI
jgi:hypothetical protein